MEFIVLAIFVLGYLFIAFEHTHIDGMASGTFTVTICQPFVVGVRYVPAHLTSDFAAYARNSMGPTPRRSIIFLSTGCCITWRH